MCLFSIPSQKRSGRSGRTPRLDAAGGLEIGVVHRQLPALALLPGEDALAHLAPVDAPEVGVQVKVVEVQPRVLDLHVHRKVVEAGGLAVEGHPVKTGTSPGPSFCRTRWGVHIAQLLGDGLGQVDGLPGGQGAEGALVIGVAAVEQAIQDRSFLSKKPGALLLRALGGVDRSQVIQFRPRRKRRSADAARAMGPGRRPCAQPRRGAPLPAGRQVPFISRWGRTRCRGP